MSAEVATKVQNAEQAPVLDKKQERAIIVELRNGKVIFKQKPISFEKQSETLQEIVTFRGMLEERINKQEPPLTTFPDEHRPLIAKLAHESDKTLIVLAKHIHHELLPTLDDDDDQSSTVAAKALPLSVVENAIKALLLRNNYGLDAPLGVKLPAAVCVWRWEVRSEHTDWLPKNSREKAEARLADRIQAKVDLKCIFEALSQDERDTIIDPKKTTAKLPAKELNKPETTLHPEGDESKPSPDSAKKQGKKKEDVENEQGDAPGAAALRPKKAHDPEKAAKEKERLAKKAARLEKEQKDKNATNKAQQMMSSFLKKPTISAKKSEDVVVVGSPKVQTDFERVFKPFVLGKEKVLAPYNWFHAEKRRRRRAAVQGSSREVIVLDSDDEHDVEMDEPQPTEEELLALSPRQRLQNSLSNISPSAKSALPHRRNPPGYKSFHSNSVRELMAKLSEAEISGNDDSVRELLDRLRNRDIIPAKAFCFHTDARPGYFGTWTRSSKIIGPRRPFAKDTLVFDYAYDSGEEWEEEPGGEDVVDDGEDEDGDNDEQDSDMDSWLVDDDEVEPDLAELARNGSPPPLWDLPVPSSKRKAEDGDDKADKKRKVVIPLVPFAKGPIWETTVGKVEYEPFKSYNIQLFNDTPMAIDPFTFVSNCLDEFRTHQRSVQANNSNPSEGVFVVPALPPRLTSTSAPVPFVASATQTSAMPPPKKAPVISKAIFPEVYMAFLLEKIKQLQASSITALVEAIYQELREHKVKKIAIETKVREVAEKCKDKRFWVVKPASTQASVP